jgi:hypothetical protein
MGDKTSVGLLRRMRFGLIGGVVAIVMAVAITEIWWPLFGAYDWRAVAVGLMIAGFLLFAAFLEFIRPPNPYSRVYPLYDLRDLGPTGEVLSSDLSWLWNAVPLALAIALIFLTGRLI